MMPKCSAPSSVQQNIQFFLLWKCFYKRKNWLFSEVLKSSHASARIYSLIETRTAKANGLEPYEYTVKVLSQLPTVTTDEQLDRLLPWRQEEAITA